MSKKSKKKKTPQVRRCCGTIYQGHLRDESLSIEDYFATLERRFVKEPGNWTDYTAGAFALEECPTTGRLHVQFYVEHSRKRFNTLANDFECLPANFEIVRSAKGSWAYCSGTGAHEGKAAISRFEFGVPKLHGEENKADLKMLVGLVMSDIPLTDIILAHPYAWCVHRARMLPFIRDWDDVQRGRSPGGQ